MPQKTTDNIFEDVCDNIHTYITSIIKNRNLKQKDIVELCKQKDINISQATVSNFINKKITLENLYDICKGLDIPIGKLFISAEDGTLLKPQNKKTLGGFYQPGDAAYSGYLGTYQFYCFQTNADESKLLHGILEINMPSEPGSQNCSAKLILETGEMKEKNQPLKKEYTGSCVASKRMSTMYLRLVSDALGEIIYLSFHHWHLLTNDLACTTAMCTTTSSGSKRRPTAARVFLCRDELSVEDQEIIKGQLRLNKAEIIISEKKFDEFLGKYEIPEEFMNLFINRLHKEKYYRIEERVLLEGHRNDVEFIKVLSLLRNYSISPKNNKISSNTDEYVYKLYQNRKKNPHGEENQERIEEQ